MLKFYILAWLIFAQVVLSERLLVKVDTGGAGILPVLNFAVPVFVFFGLVIADSRKALQWLRSRAFILFWLPYLVLTVSFPILGVLINSFPVRTLTAVQPALMPICLLIAGGWALESGVRLDLLKKFLLIAVLAQLLLALLQIGIISGYVPRAGVIGAIYDWDLDFKMTWSDSNIILARSTGTYLNPNSLGFWSVIAFWASAMFLEGKQRTSAVFAAVASLVLSSSRGALFAFVVSILVYTFAPRSAGHKTTEFLSRRTAIILVLCLFTVVFAPELLGVHGFLSESGITSRLTDSLMVITHGTDAGGNFDARINLWRYAMDFHQLHPMGTLGPPQLISGQSTDNEYVKLLLQGGWVYVLSFLWLVAGGIRLFTAEKQTAVFVAVITIAIAVNSLSSGPLAYSSAGIYWLILGAQFTAEVNGAKEKFVAFESMQPLGSARRV